jgi:excisionase family DNA binding protein
MNKAQAAEFLKVSPRTLQRLTQQGKISVSYKHTKSGAAAEYGEADLQRYLDQQNSIIYRPATAIQESQALATIPNTNLITGADRLAAALEGLQPPKKPTVPIENKLTLNLIEASALAGLSRQHLLQDIKEKKLNARKIGRGWRMKRADLDSYIKKL